MILMITGNSVAGLVEQWGIPMAKLPKIEWMESMALEQSTKNNSRKLSVHPMDWRASTELNSKFAKQLRANHSSVQIDECYRLNELNIMWFSVMNEIDGSFLFKTIWCQMWMMNGEQNSNVCKLSIKEWPIRRNGKPADTDIQLNCMLLLCLAILNRYLLLLFVLFLQSNA